MCNSTEPTSCTAMSLQLDALLHLSWPTALSLISIIMIHLTGRKQYMKYNLTKSNNLTALRSIQNSVAWRSKVETTDFPKNVIEDRHCASTQVENGIIYDKKPFKMTLVPGKKYNWCLCGHSKNQPFCDGTHRNPYLKIKQRPVRFEVAEEKDYWLCNCKQTSRRPFCDGTHKREDIQAKIK